MDFPQLVALTTHVACNFSEFSKMKKTEGYIDYVIILFTYKISSKNMTICVLCKKEKEISE